MRRASPRAARAPPGPAWKVPSPAPCSRTSVHFWTWGACHVTGPEHSREMASREDSGVLCASSFLRETAPVHPQHHEYHHRNRTHVVAAKPRCLSQEQSGAHPGLGCFPGGRKRQPFLSKRPFPRHRPANSWGHRIGFWALSPPPAGGLQNCVPCCVAGPAPCNLEASHQASPWCSGIWGTPRFLQQEDLVLPSTGRSIHVSLFI